MMRSLFAGISGLRNHQTRMDVIGNNIANVNTVGFKASRVNFQDMLSQTIQGASSGQGNLGGTNPQQVGLGMALASIDTLFTDGSTQPTGKPTDLAISGSGFFILSDGLNKVYTRAGNFDFDNQGNFLVPGTGYKVMGWLADSDGVLDTSQEIKALTLPVASTMPSKTTESITFANNLASTAPAGKVVPTSKDVFDSLGIAHSVNTDFYKVADNTWLAKISVDDPTVGVPTNTWQEITFNSDGTLKAVKSATPAIPTTSVDISGVQLDSTTGSVHKQSYTVMDASGVPKSYEATYTNSGTAGTVTTWNVSVIQTGVTGATAVTSTITYDSATSTYSGPTPAFDFNGITPTVTFAAAPGAGTFSAAATNFNGAAPAQTAPYTTSALADFSVQFAGGSDPMTIKLNLSGITQFGGDATKQGSDSTLWASDQDGYAAGTLNEKVIDGTGTIVGKFSNGKTKTLGQVALATFNNPAGLDKVGDNMYVKSNNSGDALIGPSGSGGRGKFNAGSLEMSNVDLAQEFSNMIITQRGFQANSKIITVTDEMLQDLANLKR